MTRVPAIAVLVLSLLVGAGSQAQPEPNRASQLGLADYLQRVLAANPDLKAAHATLDIARAQINVAKVFPDPEVTLGLSQYDATRRGNPTIVATQISLPIELGGKRRSRSAVAQTGLEASSLDYADAVRTLRALAANAFVDALHARTIVNQKQDAPAHLRRLVEVNERRLAAGDIAEVELLQSRVEMQRFRAEVIEAEGEQRAAEVAMAELLGQDQGPRLAANGDLRSPPPTLDQSRLAEGIDKRSDVKASMVRLEGAQRQIDLERARRVVDVTVGAGWLHNFPVGGEAGLPSADLVHRVPERPDSLLPRVPGRAGGRGKCPEAGPKPAASHSHSSASRAADRSCALRSSRPSGRSLRRWHLERCERGSGEDPV
jgi:outer membrane protein, heavy metal efflux system